METSLEPSTALFVLVAANFVAIVFAIAWLWRREKAVPAPWEIPGPFRQRR